MDKADTEAKYAARSDAYQYIIKLKPCDHRTN